MKIAHVCPFYTPAIGGVKQVVEELATRQVKSGHEVHVYTSDWDKEKRIKEKEEIIHGVYVHRCFHVARVANFATVWPSVFFRLTNNNFDVIHSHLFGHAHFVGAALAAKVIGARHIHTTHCPWSDAKRSSLGKILMNASYNTLSRFALSITDKIIAITPWEIEFIKKYGGKESKIEVIPNGMDKAIFKKIKNNSFRKKHNIPKANKIVLFFGRLNPVKGPDHFVRIAKMILKQRKKKDIAFVIMVPDEGMRATVKKLIGDEKRIILLPETRDKKDIIEMYQAAEVYVLPSYREGLPLTLFEAMAAGLPIVASPVNGIPYEMKDPENGFLIPYGKNKKYAEKIIELLDNPKLKNKISKNNIKKSKNYSWDKIFNRTMDLYKSK